MVAGVVISIMAIVKLARKLMGKEAVNAEKLAIAAFLVYVLGAALLYALNYGSVHMTYTYSIKKQFVDVSVIFNGATNAGIIIGAIAMGLGVACLVAKRGKQLLNVQKLVPTILAVVAIVFAIITTSFASGAVHTLQVSETGSKMTTTMSVATWLQMWASYMENDINLTVATYIEIIMLMLVQIAVVIVAIEALIELVDGLVNNNDGAALTINIVLVVLSVAYLVLAIVSTIEPLDTLDPKGKNGYSLTYVPAIITFVFAVLGLAVSIAKKVVNKSLSRREAVVDSTPTAAIAE